ncbi:MAG: GNAT family N-acetyltransferase [Candidatus Diapherotrites archaeon]
MAGETKIRQYKKGDEVRIKELIKSSSRPVTIQEWNWRFLENPFGEPIILIAESPDGELVGHIGAFPMELKIGETIVKAYQAIDFVVSEEFREKGIFTRLFRKGLEIVRREKLPSFGFTNREAMNAIGKKTNLRSVLGMQQYVKLFNSVPLLKLLGIEQTPKFLKKSLDAVVQIFFGGKVSTKPQKLKFEKIKVFGAEFDRIAGKIDANYNMAVKRSSKYLNWRFVGKPNNNYELFAIKKDRVLLGYVVLKLGKTSGQIVDLFFKEDESVLLETLGFCEEFLRGKGKSSISFGIYCKWVEERLFGARYVKNILSVKPRFFIDDIRAQRLGKKLGRAYLTIGDTDWA